MVLDIVLKGARDACLEARPQNASRLKIKSGFFILNNYIFILDNYIFILDNYIFLSKYIFFLISKKQNI